MSKAITTISPIGRQFYHGLASAGVTQIVAPNQNLTGLVLRTLSVNLNGNSLVVFADTTAPSSAGDYTRRPIFAAATGSGVTSNGVLPFPLYIYPGLGLWIGLSAGAGIGLTYDFVENDYRND